MEDNKDFDYVVGKLPRKNKDGKDITEDKIGKGGRRRDDGTVSSMVYDLEVVDNNPLEKVDKPDPPQRVHREYVEERSPKRNDEMTLGQRFAVEVTGAVVERLLDYAEYKITEGIDNWIENRRRKKEQEKIEARKEYIRQHRAKQEEERRNVAKAQRKKVEEKQRTKIINSIPDEVGEAYSQYSIDMTSEQAQKELVDAFILYIISAKKIWNVKHANIVDTPEKVADINNMIEKLSNPELLTSINQILDKNPALLEDWQSMALVGVFGREVVMNSKYIPIEKDDLYKALSVDSDNK